MHACMHAQLSTQTFKIEHPPSYDPTTHFAVLVTVQDARQPVDDPSLCLVFSWDELEMFGIPGLADMMFEGAGMADAMTDPGGVAELNRLVAGLQLAPPSLTEAQNATAAADLKGAMKAVKKESGCPVCGAPYVKRKGHCAGCGLVWYCSKECQTVHWKAGHKAVCKLGRELMLAEGGALACASASKGVIP